MTLPTAYTSSHPGCLARLLIFLSSLYISLLVIYFLVRLFTGDSLWWVALLNALVIYTFAPAFFFLALAMLIGQWRTAARVGIVAVIAVLWFGPFFQPKSVAPARGTTIQVLTYNLHGDENQRLDTFEAWMRQNRPDIVALQEVPSAYDQRITALEDIYPEQTRHGDLMLLSRHPILEAHPQEDYLRAIIAVGDTKIAVYTLHFAGLFARAPRIDVPILDSLTRYDETRRNEQIDALLDTVKEEAIPFIVAGDFNLSQHSIKYSSLVVEMTDSFRATSPGLGVTWSIKHGLPLLRVDYIWHGKGLRSVNAHPGPDLGSDHLPVIATLEILDTRA